MSKLIVALLLTIASVAALTEPMTELTAPATGKCSTQTITSESGKVTVCTICCFNKHCNTTCRWD